jgi:hypothetical protein
MNASVAVHALTCPEERSVAEVHGRLLVMRLCRLRFRVDRGHRGRAPQRQGKLVLGKGASSHLELEAEDGCLEAVLVVDRWMRTQKVVGGLKIINRFEHFPLWFKTKENMLSTAFSCGKGIS